MSEKSFFKNGYLRTAITVLVTLFISGMAVAAWQGINGISEEEVREDFVTKEVYQIQMNQIMKELGEIKGTIKEVDRKLNEHK